MTNARPTPAEVDQHEEALKAAGKCTSSTATMGLATPSGTTIVARSGQRQAMDALGEDVRLVRKVPQLTAG